MATKADGGKVEAEIMKAFKTVLLAVTMSVGIFGAASVQAHPGHFHGYVGVGVAVDPWPAFYPGWGYYPYSYYPYYAYQPVIVEPPAPVAYIEQNRQPQEAAPVQAGDWYYCRKPAGYYPYVRNCEKAWERVPAQPRAQQ
ncbi:MAG TPA: hypothetical protein VF472_02445 [Burkholderiaceae bacterium]